MTANPIQPANIWNSLVLPVPRDSYFGVEGGDHTSVSFWWVPLGAGNPRVVGELGPAELPELPAAEEWSLAEQIAAAVEGAEGEDAARLRRALRALLADGA